MEKPLPERFLRGLRDKDFVVRDNNGAFICISERAYEPNLKSRNHRVSNAGKSDHYESSINWEDELVEAFQILSEDTQNAAFGIVSIRLEDLKRAKADNPLAIKYLEWERDALTRNPFHGNLLFSGNMLKPQIRQLAAVIASYVDGNLSNQKITSLSLPPELRLLSKAKLIKKSLSRLCCLLHQVPFMPMKFSSQAFYSAFGLGYNLSLSLKAILSIKPTSSNSHQEPNLHSFKSFRCKSFAQQKRILSIQEVEWTLIMQLST